MFKLLTFTLDNVPDFHARPVEKARVPLRNRGLMTIFIDKITKLFHIALLHPRDYSVDMIGKFLTETPLDDTTGTVPRNWLAIIKMFRLIGSQHSQTYYGHIDVKLAICRFVAELLIRLPQSSIKGNFLDETAHWFDSQKYM